MRVRRVRNLDFDVDGDDNIDADVDGDDNTDVDVSDDVVEAPG